MESIKENILRPLKRVEGSFRDDAEWLAYQQDKDLYIANDAEGNLKYIDCPVCKNKGYIAFRDHLNYISVRDCSCMIERKISERIERSGLKSSFQKYRFDNYTTHEYWQELVFKTANNYISVIKDVEVTEKHWFVIAGQVGSGKSHICTAIVDSLIKLGLDIEYIPFITNMASLQTRLNSFNVDTKEVAEKELKRMKEVQVLYIDDFMKTKTVKIDLIFDIIDSRYRNSKLITIISSELSFDDMSKVDIALASRIKERTSSFWLNIKNDEKKNQRLKGHA